MREYHVDSFEKIDNCKLILSAWCNPQLRSIIIIIGQDESVFKQYSFGQQCWFVPNGEAELILKTDSCSQIVSAFVLRSFGVGIQWSEEELVKVNEPRTSEKWGKCMETKAVMKIHGSTQTNNITDKLTLVQFFDIVINEEGCWNYLCMALHIEDIFDVLRVKFPEYILWFQWTKVVVTGRRWREGGSNTMEMWVRVSDLQKKIKNATINVLGTYPACLNVGITQLLSFVFGDKVSFYLLAEERESLKYDTFSGEKEILNKTKKDGGGGDQGKWI